MANENEFAQTKTFAIFVSLITVIMFQTNLSQSLGTDASSLHGSGDEPSVFGASLCMSVLECPICHKKFQKRNGSINEAHRRGMKIFCSKKCFGITRRKENTLHQIIKKICKCCREEKSADCFSQNGTNRWLNGKCKDCERRLSKRGRINPVLNPEELFADIEGTGGQYRIGNHGTLISFGKDIDKMLFKIIPPYKCPKGYLFSYIRVNGRRKIVKAHRLVAKHFIPNPENKPQVNHKDSNRANPHHTNLEWATRKENRQHAFDYGYACNKGINHPGHKLNESQVMEIFNSPLTPKDLAKIFPVTATTIGNIKTGKIWAHLTKKIFTPKRKKYAK